MCLCLGFVSAKHYFPPGFNVCSPPIHSNRTIVFSPFPFYFFCRRSEALPCPCAISIDSTQCMLRLILFPCVCLCQPACWYLPISFCAKSLWDLRPEDSWLAMSASPDYGGGRNSIVSGYPSNGNIIPETVSSRVQLLFTPRSPVPRAANFTPTALPSVSWNTRAAGNLS